MQSVCFFGRSLLDRDRRGERGGGGGGADLPGAGGELPEGAAVVLRGDRLVVYVPMDGAGEGGGELEHLLGGSEDGIDDVMGTGGGIEDAGGGADLGAEGVAGACAPCGVFGRQEEGAIG